MAERRVLRLGTIVFIGVLEDCQKVAHSGQPLVGPLPKDQTHFTMKFEKDGSLAVYPVPEGYSLMIGRPIRMPVVVQIQEKKRGRRNDLRQGRGEGRQGK